MRAESIVKVSQKLQTDNELPDDDTANESIEYKFSESRELDEPLIIEHTQGDIRNH